MAYTHCRFYVLGLDKYFIFSKCFATDVDVDGDSGAGAVAVADVGWCYGFSFGFAELL